MRLQALRFFYDLLLVFVLFCLVLETQSFPPAIDQAPALATSSTSSLSPHTVTAHKRTLINQGPFSRILANGWRVTFTLLSLVDPILLARENLRNFYTEILHKNYLDRLAGNLLGPSVEFTSGRLKLSFFAERGFAENIDPDVIIAFASKVYEMTVPVTFICRVRPPHQDAGIFISLFLDGRQ
ncbi:MAG: hypothetical protein Q9202_000671 [Teloschistes flavicans]